MLRSLLKYRSLWSSKYLGVVLSVRHYSNLKKSSNAVELVESWRQKFTELQIPEVKSSLDNILGCVLKRRKVYGLSERRDLILTQEEVNEFNRLCHCREARMPIQYIVGEWEFRDLHLKMQPPVFIPRPETEGLVELILKKNKSTEFVRFLEIGCGSGAVSLALLSALPNAKCKAVDQSSMACFLTLKNAISLKLSDRISVSQHKVNDEIKDEDFCEKFDFIVLLREAPKSQRFLLDVRSGDRR
uniref:HemK methyltransferase family member 1 n=2 Tax=Lutzomyia longipalpis TaxID=7200 RepID=A0A1B0CK48_LUTLO